CSSYAGSNVLF
nr:immunoglobulin light chain junction region [Macaca mulatta]MPO02974.1 immunoglobulin light chain junction region [Macaca mulatta]MPO02983.1 immunoglobulin light chain junction region [Macaca mulatta]MPO02988.1 immunoglobulin light chain junction region [Macaca mulatta]MPO02991.1 immunoglobulin light chain junction region [Macaca mulatta]